jgi:hypothetical protein
MSGPQYQEGVHIGEIKNQALSKAKTGNYQVVLGVKILGIPNEDGSYDPHKFQNARTIYLTITDKTIDFVIPKLEAIGFTGSSFGQIDPAHAQSVNLVGQQVDLWCKHETGQDGQLREKWDISTGLKGVQTEALTTKEIRQLDTLFGKALKNKPQSNVSTKQRSAPVKEENVNQEGPPEEDSSDPGISDDDIPF